MRKKKNAIELSNNFGFSPLTHTLKVLLDTEILKEGFCNKTVSDVFNHLFHQVIEKA